MHKTPKTPKRIQKTTEEKKKQRLHDLLVWDLGRSIFTAQPGLDSYSLRNEVRRQHQGPAEDFDAFFVDVRHAYDAVRIPLGHSPLQEAIAADFDSPINDSCPLTRRLAGCCNFFALKHGGRPFPLSGATATKAMGLLLTPANRTRAWRITQKLIGLKVIEEYEKGENGSRGPSGRASTFIYIWPEPPALRFTGWETA